MSEENTETKKKKIVLAIETAVEGGSLALFENDILIDGWTGTGVVSRSEDVLGEIRNLLEKNVVRKSEIKSIVVSGGPGSITGARIGEAIARGLCKSLGCEFTTRTVLEAMASSVRRLKRNSDTSENSLNILAAIPCGRRQIFRQLFQKNQAGRISNFQAPETENYEDFVARLKTVRADIVILHESIHREFVNSGQAVGCKNPELISAGYNLAALIGTKTTAETTQTTIISPPYV